jgi:pimeloyl-ACP methyl ester carboxylesterase
MNPELWKDTTVGPYRAGTQHFVYIHGIRSQPDTFAALEQYLKQKAQDPKLNKSTWTVAHHSFSYPWWNSMVSNGDALAKELVKLGASERSVTLFGHSMGGLVGRLAILSPYSGVGGTVAHKLIKRLIMFGTPNHGAVRAASLKWTLTRALHRGFSMIEGNYPRSPGILDLTEVTKVFQKPLEQRRHHADGIEYVTIPGTYFNENRHELDHSGLSDMMNALGTVNILLKAAYAPELPHDGIVEQKSVRLNHGSKSGWRSEKEKPYKDFGAADIDDAHMHLVACDRLDHLTVHQDEEILKFVATLAFEEKLCSLKSTQYETDLWRHE